LKEPSALAEISSERDIPFLGVSYGYASMTILYLMYAP